MSEPPVPVGSIWRPWGYGDDDAHDQMVVAVGGLIVQLQCADGLTLNPWFLPSLLNGAWERIA